MVANASFSRGLIFSAVFESHSWNSFQQGLHHAAPACKGKSNDQKIIKENKSIPDECHSASAQWADLHQWVLAVLIHPPSTAAMPKVPEERDVIASTGRYWLPNGI